MVKSADSSASRQQPPKFVRNAVGLLRLQATIWALLSAGVVAGDSVSLARAPSKVTMTAVVVTVVLALAAGTFAAAKFRLAHRLPRGTERTREAVITVETLMAGFAGLVLLFLTVTGFGLILSPPFLIGGIMCVRVVRGLTKPRAEQYSDASESVGGQSANLRSPDGGSPAQFQGYLATAYSWRSVSLPGRS
jgi:hypothetical protein